MTRKADNESLSSLIDQARRLALKAESKTTSSSSGLVIGIDFGTTYTGVGYAIHSSSGEHSVLRSKAEADAIIEKIVVIKNWPNEIQQSSEKTQTLLAYDNGQLIAWGGRAKSSNKTKVSHFKLGLQENIGEHYRDNRPDSNSLLGGFLRNSNWKHESLPNKNAVDFAADYLTAIRQYVVDVVLPRHFGREFLNNLQFSYVLTVPAIWTDKAKDLTRKASIAAGIPDDRLSLISEPEAAALYCATICEEVDLRDGDRFLVCDAGGGTVVTSGIFMLIDIGSNFLSRSIATPV
jgi:molecular chaperone DnaK (HSP70)